MKSWFRKVLLLFWPWSKIDELQRALTQANEQIIAASNRYNAAYRDGFNAHLQNWMAQANMYYSAEPFTDGQKVLMIKLYQDGYTFREALGQLRIAEGRGPAQWTR